MEYVLALTTLYAGVVSAVDSQWATAPCPVEIPVNHWETCECLSFEEIHCRHLDKLPTFNGDGREYSAIFMSRQNISGVNGGAFFDLRVRKIVMNYNPLGNNLDERAFSGLGDVLVELQMGGCGMETLPDLLLQDLRELRVLHMWGNKLDTLPGRLFANTPQLIELLLWGNRITVLDTESFSGLGNLLRLDLDYNHIADLDKESFRSLPKLESLRLGGNRLETLYGKIFEYLTNLKVLNLDSNGLRVLFDDHVFDGVSGLRSLRMQHNQIEVIPAFCFKNLRNLTSLFLRDNKLKILWSRTFNRLESLQVCKPHFNLFCLATMIVLG